MQKVFAFLKKHKVFIVVIIVLLITGTVLIGKARNSAPAWMTTTVTMGSVSHVVSVSGIMNATQKAELSFPISGTLEAIRVHEGDEVKQGDELASLVHNELTAEYQDAQAALLIAQADYAELVNGLRPEARDVTKTKVAIAKEELERVTREENMKLESAYRTLLSSDLIMKPINSNNNDTPPTVSGTYTCGIGEYQIEVFRSGAASGYSYQYSGLETGTESAYAESSAPLGKCGLLLRFAKNVSYGGSKWILRTPNTESSTYTTNYNAYILAKTARDNAIQSATQALELAERTEALDTANPRSESNAREEAKVLQAQARLDRVAAQIKNSLLTAPFDGVVTHIDPVPGEIVSGKPVVTILSRSLFEITALVPEIDVTRIAKGESADIVFDARPTETLKATIDFISPLAREIDGVSYFETKLYLNEPTTWLQSGLNADVNIITEKHDNVLRIPERYLVHDGSEDFVLIPDGKKSKRTPIKVTFKGNDGYIEVGGLKEGDTIIAP